MGKAVTPGDVPERRMYQVDAMIEYADAGYDQVACGQFAADMKVYLVNDLQASIDSKSFMEPPGWITAFTPWANPTSIPSLKGKKASEIMEDPIRPPLTSATSASISARLSPSLKEGPCPG